jgi:hypothetical protein
MQLTASPARLFFLLAVGLGLACAAGSWPPPELAMGKGQETTLVWLSWCVQVLCILVMARAPYYLSHAEALLSESTPSRGLLQELRSLSQTSPRTDPEAQMAFIVARATANAAAQLCSGAPTAVVAGYAANATAAGGLILWQVRVADRGCDQAMAQHIPWIPEQVARSAVQGLLLGCRCSSLNVSQVAEALILSGNRLITGELCRVVLDLHVCQ